MSAETRRLLPPDPEAPVFLAAAPLRARRPVSERSQAARRGHAAESAAGGALAGLVVVLLTALLPVPEATGGGPGALARSLLWLGLAGGLAGAVFGGMLAASTGSVARAAARGLLAGLWGFWVGSIGALMAALGAYKVWMLVPAAAPILSFPPGPLAMGLAAWIVAGTAWAGLLGLALPLAPGRPGGNPLRSGCLALLAGFGGSVATVLSGIAAPGMLLLGAALALGARHGASV